MVFFNANYGNCFLNQISFRGILLTTYLAQDEFTKLRKTARKKVGIFPPPPIFRKREKESNILLTFLK